MGLLEAKSKPFYHEEHEVKKTPKSFSSCPSWFNACGPSAYNFIFLPIQELTALPAHSKKLFDIHRSEAQAVGRDFDRR